MSLIQVQNIAKKYSDGTEALKDVTFTINAGEFVGIMGPSGSGKSTLLHIIGFLDSQSGGEFSFEGKTFDDYSQNEIARLRNERMGFVFQAFHLLPRTSVLENVELPLMYSQIPKSEWKNKALVAIDAVGLTHRLNHDPSKLSGGEKQRVAIARALVNEPQVVFADEPTGNLDTHAGSIVMNTLTRLNREKGHTVIVITHEAETAEHADRIIYIRDGQVEKDVRTKEKVESILNGSKKKTERN